jgi:hypothetical protein
MSTATRACGCGAMTSSDGFEPLSVEIEFCQVDPELLNLLTGGAFDKDTPTEQPTFAVEAYIPIKRTFWQWLLRKPRQHKIIYIPRATIQEAP